MAEFYFFYDPSRSQVVKLRSAGNANESWLPLTESYADQLITGTKNGGVIYQNLSGYPVLHFPPPIPPHRWDQYVELTPLAIVNDVPTQIWIISDYPIEVKLAKLAEVRYYKQISIPFQMAIVKKDPNGGTIYKDCITDVGTTQMMTQAIATCIMNPNYIFSDWKFGTHDWQSVHAKDLQEAWGEASEIIQDYFTIERRYSERILRHIPVDITQWVLLDPITDDQ